MSMCMGGGWMMAEAAGRMEDPDSGFPDPDPKPDGRGGCGHPRIRGAPLSRATYEWCVSGGRRAGSSGLPQEASPDFGGKSSEHTLHTTPTSLPYKNIHCRLSMPRRRLLLIPAHACPKEIEANARTAKGRQLHMMYVRIDIKADL